MREIDQILWGAVEAGNPEGIAVALAAGANPNATNNASMGALHVAVCNSDSNSVLALLKGGANPNTPVSLSAMRPLHFAGRSGDKACIALLVRFGADLDGYDAMENGALHYAAEANNVIVFAYLLRLGANPYARNKQGKGVLDVTTSFHIIAALGDFGASRAALW
jgi:uncharacterized protein